LSEISFFCPYCLRYVKSPIISESWGSVVRCPNCYPSKPATFNVKVEVDIPKERIECLALERTHQLQQECCEFDGVGYTLKKEHWKTALKHAFMEFWGSGEGGYAFLVVSIPIPLEERPPEIYWGACYLVLGNFQEPKDTTNPEKVRLLYVVESREEAMFIIRAKERKKVKSVE
jgi:hypothetical protein